MRHYSYTYFHNVGRSLRFLPTLGPPRHKLLRLKLLNVANYGENFVMVGEVLEFYILTEPLADFANVSNITHTLFSLIC